MRQILYEECVPSSHTSRPPLIRRLLRFFLDNDFHTSLDRYELELVLDEAVTNAMEHGNRWNETKSIYICIALEEDFILVIIRDQGLGFIPQNAQPSNQGLNPRGRGLLILRTFCEVSWNSLGNEITLKLRRL